MTTFLLKGRVDLALSIREEVDHALFPFLKTNKREETENKSYYREILNRKKRDK